MVAATTSDSAGDQVLTFRQLDLADVEWFVGIRNMVRESLHDPRAFTASDARGWFLRTRPDLRVIERAGVPVGYFRIGPLDADDNSLWIGADLDPAFHGQGIASRAYWQFMPELIDEFRVEALVLRVRPWNIPAMRLYRRLGFVTTAVEVGATDARGGAAPLTDIAMRWAPGASGGAATPADAVDLILASVTEGAA